MRNSSVLGTIIILNGPSGVGKSTIQKAVQDSFDQLYLRVGIDKFFDEALPDCDGSENEDGSLPSQEYSRLRSDEVR